MTETTDVEDELNLVSMKDVIEHYATNAKNVSTAPLFKSRFCVNVIQPDIDTWKSSDQQVPLTFMKY